MSYLPNPQRRPERPNFRSTLTFDTALDFSEAYYACKGKLLNKSHPTDREIVRKFNDLGYSLITKETQWAFWMESIFVAGSRHNTDVRRQLKEATNVAKIMTEFQYEGMIQGLHHDMVAESVDLLSALLSQLTSLPLRCESFWGAAKELFDVVKKSRICYSKKFKDDPWTQSSEHSTSIPRIFNESSCKIRFGHRLIFLEQGVNVRVFPKDWLFMVAFKSLEAFNILTSTYLRQGVDLQPDAYPLMEQYLLECVRILIIEGPAGFDKIKSLEGVHVGLIIQDCDKFTEIPLLEATIGSLDTPGWQYTGSNICVSLSKADYPLRIELLSLHKLVGHPSVSSIAGFDKVLRRGCASKPVDFDHISDVIAYATRSICTRYFDANGKWPLVSLGAGVGRRMMLAFLNNWSLNDRRIPQGLSRPALGEWLCISFEKNQDFNYISSVIPLLKDKATSPVSDAASSYYQFCAGVTNEYASLSQEQRNDAASRTRLLLSYVMRQDIGAEIRDFLDKFQVDPELVTDFLIIKLTAKEKELKREPRMFGLSTLENRSRLLLTSKNLDPFLKSYSPNVCFSLTKEELIKKMLAMKDLAYLSLEPSETFFAHIDSSGWCSAFRREVCAPFGKLLDKWFGTRLYEQSQETYSRTKLIAYQYGELKEADGMEGGIEGLDQPFWTWIYDNSITTSLDKLQYPSQGCVKGDDAKYGILVPTVEVEKNSYNEIARRLANEVQTAIERIGQSGKVEETFISTKLLTFNKKWCLDHIFLPNMSKALAKVHGYGESCYPTVTDLVGTCFSNAHSACSEGNLHVIPYIMACMNATWHLQSSSYSELSENAKAVLLMWPSCAGGMPILLLSDFFVNSESDQLTGFLALYNTADRIKHPLRDLMGNILKVPMEQCVNILPLCQDPYSVNISRPQDPSVILRKVMRSQIEKVALNPDLKAVFSPSASLYECQLSTALDNMDTLPAKPLNALYSGSILGLQQDILAKFETSHSMFNFLARTKYGNFRLARLHRRLQKADLSVVNWRKNLVMGVLSTSSNILSFRDGCSAKWAQSCRDWCWRKPVFGVTYPNLTEMSFCIPSEVGDLLLDDGTMITIRNAFVLRRKPDGPYSTKYISDHFRNGVFKPFLGKVTAEVLSLPTLHLESDSPCVAKILQLLKLHAFMDVVGSDFNKLVEHAISYLSVKSLDELMPFRQTKQRGTTTHRLRARGFKESIHINRYPNAYSEVQGDSSYNSDSRLQENVTMNFLELLVYESEMALLPLEFTSSLPPTPKDFLFTIRNCPTCLADIDDTVIKLGYHPPKGEPAHSKLLAVDQQTIGVIEEKLAYLATQYDIQVPTGVEDLESTHEMILVRFWRERRVDLRWTSMTSNIKLKSHHAGLVRDLSGQTTLTKPADKSCLVTLTALLRIPMSTISSTLVETFYLGVASREETAFSTEEALSTGIAYIAGGCSYLWDSGLGSAVVRKIRDYIIEEGEDDVTPLAILPKIHTDVSVFLKSFKQSMHSLTLLRGTKDVSVRVLDGTETAAQKGESLKAAIRKALHAHLDSVLPDIKQVSNPGDSETQFEYIQRNWEFNKRLRKAIFLACAATAIECDVALDEPDRIPGYAGELKFSDLNNEVLSRRMMTKRLRDELEKRLGMSSPILRTSYHLMWKTDQDWLDDYEEVLFQIRTEYMKFRPRKAVYAVPYAIDLLRQCPRLTEYHSVTEDDDSDHQVSDLPYPIFNVPELSFRIKGDENPAVPSSSVTKDAPFSPVEWPDDPCDSNMHNWFFVNKHNIAGRSLGTSTSGACEAHVIISQVELQFTASIRGPKIACLADGNGGFSVYMASKYPASRVFYSNPPLLGRAEQTSTESMNMRYPTLALELKSNLNNVDTVTLNWDVSCNLAEENFWERFSKLGIKMSLITITADSEIRTLCEVLRLVCKYRNILITGGAVLIGIKREMLCDTSVLNTVLSGWEHVSVINNITSSYLGRDGWLLLQSPTATDVVQWSWREVRFYKATQWIQDQREVDPMRAGKLYDILSCFPDALQKLGCTCLSRLRQRMDMIVSYEMYGLSSTQAQVLSLWNPLTTEKVADLLAYASRQPPRMKVRLKDDILQWCVFKKLIRQDWTDPYLELDSLTCIVMEMENEELRVMAATMDDEVRDDIVRWAFARVVQLSSYRQMRNIWAVDPDQSGT